MTEQLPEASLTDRRTRTGEKSSRDLQIQELKKKLNHSIELLCQENTFLSPARRLQTARDAMIAAVDLQGLNEIDPVEYELAMSFFVDLKAEAEAAVSMPKS